MTPADNLIEHLAEYIADFPVRGSFGLGMTVAPVDGECAIEITDPLGAYTILLSARDAQGPPTGGTPPPELVPGLDVSALELARWIVPGVPVESQITERCSHVLAALNQIGRNAIRQLLDHA